MPADRDLLVGLLDGIRPGLSLIAAIAVVLVAAAVLAPIWLPVLAVVGIISLFRRNRPVTA
jgi:hypothetical protein